MFDIDKNQFLINLAQKTAGKILLLIFFASGFILNPDLTLTKSTIIIGILTLITFLPKWRRYIIFGATFIWTFTFCSFLWPELIKKADQLHVKLPSNSFTFLHVAIGLVLLFLIAYVFVVKTKRLSIVHKHPVATLLTILLTLIIAASNAPISNTAKMYFLIFATILARYIWFVSYTLIDKKPCSKKELILQFGLYLPFWASIVNTPFPKGAAYLRKIEAKDAKELAITQLKAIKLLYWAIILLIILGVMTIAQTYFKILPMVFALKACAAHHHISALNAWSTMIFHFFKILVQLAILGHFAVATIRMAGFNALRNTYKPLQSKTIAEFWNRYYYYFKELLVEFFFYPTYFRFFKNSPRLRIFFATMAAAFFGNVIFHFLTFFEQIIRDGFFVALYNLHVYMFYAFILGLGISFSQLRNLHKPQHNKSRLQKFFAPIIVVGFYCLISPFNHPYETHNISVNFMFMRSLV